MNDPINRIKWKARSGIFDLLFRQNGSLSVMPLAGGFEADVCRIVIDGSSFVLKQWNKIIQPDVESQYNLLDALFNRGFPVPQPLAWGMDQEGYPALLTSFNGEPIPKVDQPLLAIFAGKLSEIHKIHLADLAAPKLQKPDLVSYFYPRIELHPDLHVLLMQLVESSNMKQDRLIHGDFNLGNILEEAGKYTIIDWTDGQPGDPRFDIAWSVMSASIYAGPEHASFYRSAFQVETNYTTDELELFEAIACIRWLLINRLVDLKEGEDTIARVKGILRDNVYLSERLIDQNL